MPIELEELLKKDLRDEVLIMPTDTVYGVGCLLNSQRGVEKIFALKGRDQDKPLAVLCPDMECVKTLSENYEDFRDLAKAHWPGALTLVVKKSEAVPDYVTRGMKTVGLRIPNHDKALAILKRYGPMAVTSLNLSNEPPILKLHDAEVFEESVDHLVSGGDLKGVASTVYDTLQGKVLRQGEVKFER